MKPEDRKNLTVTDDALASAELAADLEEQRYRPQPGEMFCVVDKKELLRHSLGKAGAHIAKLEAVLRDHRLRLRHHTVTVLSTP